jgi:high-affinity iron transporter
MLMWHNAWMARHGREIADEMRRVGTAVSEGAKPLTALAVVVGLAVLREGSEVVLFLYGILASGTSVSATLLGGVLGIVAGAAFTALTYLGLLAIPNRHIFSVTSWLIALLAAGMAAQAVHFLNNAGLVVALDRTVWDTSRLLSENSILGRMPYALIGYTERPTQMQLLVHPHADCDVSADALCALPPPKRPCRRRATISGASPTKSVLNAAARPACDVGRLIDQFEQCACGPRG